MKRVLLTAVAALGLASCASPPPPAVHVTSAAGPSRQVLGVGVGYAHDEAGAEAAAVTYAEAAATPVFPVDDASERQRVATYAVGSEQAALLAKRLESIRGYDSSYGVVSAHGRGQRAGAHLYPLSVRLQAYTDTDATVSVWAMLVEYSPSVFRALYLTESVALQWEAGDWKYVLSRTTATLGPAPEITQAQTTTQPPDQVDWQAWGR
ncbi:MAG TPA: hypothetical protein VOB72_15180 [Candidatus Dormibacteraeota bacterium]|nr:hypothetical protein [Candidatus Dormibacteraeota bacterium]